MSIFYSSQIVENSNAYRNTDGVFGAYLSDMLYSSARLLQ